MFDVYRELLYLQIMLALLVGTYTHIPIQLIVSVFKTCIHDGVGLPCSLFISIVG